MPEEIEKPLHGTISLSRKVNLGNYESADVFLSISGITSDSTKEEMESLLEGNVNEAYRLLKTHIHHKIRDIKSKGGN